MSVVAVTGGSGLLGTNLILQLVDAGHEVRALARSDASVAHLKKDPRGSKITFHKGDLDDVEAMAACFSADGKGVDCVFHVAAAVSILSKPTPALIKANVTGTANALVAFKKSGAKRFVHTSSTVCTGVALPGAPDTDESSPWNFHEVGLADGYSITKKDSEKLVLKAAEEGVDVVIVNPGYMFGPYDSKPSSGKLILDLVKGKVPGVTPGINSFVDVRDVCTGMIAAWHKGRRGERYILAGHNLTYKDMFNRIATCAGVKAPSLNVPYFATAVLGLFGDLQAVVTGKEPLLTSAAARYAYSDGFRISSKKAQQELGYVISPIEPAINDCLAWFKENGRL